jgi:hypothetical protein
MSPRTWTFEKPSLNIITSIINIIIIIVIIIIIIAISKYIFFETRTQDGFPISDLISCNLSDERNFWAVFLSWFVYQLLNSSLGLEHRTVFQGSCLCFYNFLFETNDFVLGAFLLPCLVSVLQKPLSQDSEPRTHPWVLTFVNFLSGLKK